MLNKNRRVKNTYKISCSNRLAQQVDVVKLFSSDHRIFMDFEKQVSYFCTRFSSNHSKQMRKRFTGSTGALLPKMT